jgi:hypothetical protein
MFNDPAEDYNETDQDDNNILEAEAYLEREALGVYDDER